MKITLELLKDLDACDSGLDWFEENINEPIEHDELINRIIEDNIEWAIWLLIKLLTRKNKIKLAIHTVRKALPIFEKEYPNDNRPRKAIEDTEKYLNNEISIGELIESRDEAYEAVRATTRASRASLASRAAFYAATYAVADFLCSAVDAADAVDAAVDAVNKKTSLIDTINYGLELMKNNEE